MALDPTTFEYLKPTDNQLALMGMMRNATRVYADAIERTLNDGPDKTFILRAVRSTAMWINIALTRHADGAPRRPTDNPGQPATDNVELTAGSRFDKPEPANGKTSIDHIGSRFNKPVPLYIESHMNPVTNQMERYELLKEVEQGIYTLQTWNTPEGQCSVAKWAHMSNKEACNSARSLVYGMRTAKDLLNHPSKDTLR